MGKILYITVDTKPENESVCKMIGKDLVNKLISKHPDSTVEELDLYASNLPEMSSEFVTEEISLVTGDAYQKLSDINKKAVDRIDELCNQFLNSDIYIIAAPMWSLSFPSKLKQYIDCIVLGNKFLVFEHGNNKPKPLLNDKKRSMVYIQTSGGDFPFWMEYKINYGVDYCHDLFKGLGMEKFEKVLVEGTIQYKDEKDKYMHKAYKDIEKIIEQL
jgi:FMN-dependent NADH-azoreductase